MRLEIIKNLQRPSALFLAIGFSVLFFDLSYYFMSTLPGHKDLACVIGAGLTFWNMMFSIALSLMAGVMVAGIFALYKKHKSRLAVSSLSGFGVLIGTMTIFCTACTLPVISLFGLSIGLTFFTTYNLTFKILSLAVMATGLYLLNGQMADKCKICRI